MSALRIPGVTALLDIVLGRGSSEEEPSVVEASAQEASPQDVSAQEASAQSEGGDMSKLKLALYWGASCGGCDIAVLDINEKILDVAAIADIVLWPIAMDFKYSDVEALEDGEIDVCLFNGAVGNSEQEELARLLRRKSKAMVAFGACAHVGGIPALANFHNRRQRLDRAYHEAPTNFNPDGVEPQTTTTMPEGDLELPLTFDTVKRLQDVVEVEYFVPGCPPVVDQVEALVEALATGNLPPAGAVIAGDKALCDECERERTGEMVNHIYRSHEIITDPERCLLEQGLMCLGSVTRAGCGSRCVNVNMPCRGCFGPGPGIEDQGTRFAGAIASIYDAEDEESISRMLDEMVDPAGTFYRFSLAAPSILPRMPE